MAVMQYFCRLLQFSAHILGLESGIFLFVFLLFLCVASVTIRMSLFAWVRSDFCSDLKQGKGEPFFLIMKLMMIIVEIKMFL